MEHEGGALAHKAKKAKKPKALKEFHAKELHDGSYHFAKHSGEMGEPPEEGSAKGVDELKEELAEHMGGAGAKPAPAAEPEPPEPVATAAGEPGMMQ